VLKKTLKTARQEGFSEPFLFHVIAIEHNRQHLSYDFAKERVEETLLTHIRSAIEERKGLGIDDHTLKEIIKGRISIRYALVNSVHLKSFLRKNGNTAFLKSSWPKYIWYAELYDQIRGNSDQLLGAIAIDASSHRYDSLYSILNRKQEKRKNSIELIRTKEPIDTLELIHE